MLASTAAAIRVWARDSDKAAFADVEGPRHQVTIERSATVREAVAGADIICTVTKAARPHSSASS